jgi:hypothetical protein
VLVLVLATIETCHLPLLSLKYSVKVACTLAELNDQNGMSWWDTLA